MGLIILVFMFYLKERIVQENGVQCACCQKLATQVVMDIGRTTEVGITGNDGSGCQREYVFRPHTHHLSESRIGSSKIRVSEVQWENDDD